MIVNNYYRHSGIHTGIMKMKDDVRVPFSFNGHWCKSEQTKNNFNCRIQLNLGIKSTDCKDIHARKGNSVQKKRLRVKYNIPRNR